MVWLPGMMTAHVDISTTFLSAPYCFLYFLFQDIPVFFKSFWPSWSTGIWLASSLWKKYSQLTSGEKWYHKFKGAKGVHLLIFSRAQTYNGTLLLPLPKLRYYMALHIPLYVVPGLVYARQALYQLGHIPGNCPFASVSSIRTNRFFLWNRLSFCSLGWP